MDLKAKKHDILNKLKSELSKGFIEKKVSLSGFEFVLRTLCEDDDIWSDGYHRSSTPTAMINSRKAPKLAAAIYSINGVVKDQLFIYPDDMPKEIKDELNSNPIQKKYWLSEQMLYFLSEDANRPFISKLFDAYTELENERDEAVKQLPL